MPTPAHQPALAAIVAFPTPATASPIQECPTCAGNGDNAHGPCFDCRGQALVTCACGACEGGLVIARYEGDGEPVFAICDQARPATDAERDAYHDAFLARRGAAEPFES